MAAALPQRLSIMPLPTPGVYSFNTAVNVGTYNGSYINVNQSMQDLQKELQTYSLDNTHVGSSMWVCATTIWGLAGVYVLVNVWRQARRRNIAIWPTRSRGSRTARRTRPWSIFRSKRQIAQTRGISALDEKRDVPELSSPTHPAHVILGDVAEGIIFGRRAARTDTGQLSLEQTRSRDSSRAHTSAKPSSSDLRRSVRFSDMPTPTAAGTSLTQLHPDALAPPKNEAYSNGTSPPISPFLQPDAFAANRPHVNALSRAIAPPDDTGPVGRHKRQRRLEWSSKFPLYIGICGLWLFPWSMSMHIYQAILGQPMSGVVCRLVGIGYLHSSLLPLILTMVVGLVVSVEAHQFKDIRLGWMDWRLTGTAFVMTLVLSLLPLAQGGYDNSPHICLAGGLGPREYWLPLMNLAIWIVVTVISVTAYVYTLHEQKIYDSDREVTRRVMIYGMGCIIGSAFQLPARIFLIINPEPETIAMEEEDLALQILSSMYPLIVGAVLGICYVFWDEKASGAEFRNRLSVSRAIRTTPLDEKDMGEPEYEDDEAMRSSNGFGLDWEDDFQAQSWSSLTDTERQTIASASSKRSSQWSFHHIGTFPGEHHARPATLISIHSSPSVISRQDSADEIQIAYCPGDRADPGEGC